MRDSGFENWALTHQYDIAPALTPSEIRIYADRQTQAAFDAWQAGARSIAVMFTESAVETEAFREKIRQPVSDA